MNHIKTILAVTAVISLTVLCACSPGGAASGNNPVPKKDQTSVSSLTESNTADKSDKKVSFWLEHENEWSNAELMPDNGMSGVYATGYCMLDIDLDGEKEMLVQISSGANGQCNTNIYKIGDDGNIFIAQQKEGISLAVEGLSLWNDISGEKFYISETTYKSDDQMYTKIWSKLYCENGILSENTLFRTETVFGVDANGSEEIKYYSGLSKKALTQEKFNEEYQKYFDGCKNMLLKTEFISSSDWKLFTDLQKKDALIRSYKK